jgi:hypothetical protein
MSDNRDQKLFDLLARWRAFSELQQRAFAFLAGEALASGAAFENSTEGATRVLTRIGDIAKNTPAAEVQAETWSVVHRLQAADRSRQGLEQIATVLGTLRQQHAALVDATRAATDLPDVEVMIDDWIAVLCGTVTLTDWRRRLDDALHGRPPSEAADCTNEDELF